MLRWRVSALLLAGTVCLPCTGLAAPKAFDFKDPKGVNAVVVTLDSLLEPVSGIARGVTGTVQFDPDRPEETSGKIVVEVASLQFPHERYTATAHGERGLDGQKYPNIEFALKSVRNVKKTGSNVFQGTVVGDFSVHGVTRSLAVPVKATYLPGKAAARNRGAAGDLLVLRAVFPIKRGDFDISRGLSAELLAEEIEIRVAIVGAAPQASTSAAR